MEEAKERIDRGENLTKEYGELRREYREINQQKDEGRKIRGKVEGQGENELASIANITKERTNGESKIIKEVKKGDRKIRDRDGIAQHIKDFFSAIWTKETYQQNKRFAFLAEIEEKIDEQEAEALKQEISIQEIQTAIFSMKEKKAPGIDGIPIEVYKTFWSVTKNTLHNLFNEIVRSDTLGESQKTSVVSLIHKGGDRAEIKNWRPISLLCTDYKIIAKIITNRLKPLLEKAIGEEQKGGLKGRQLTDNLNSIRTAIIETEYPKEKQNKRKQQGQRQERRDKRDMGGKKAAIIGLDFEKTFDRV